MLRNSITTSIPTYTSTPSWQHTCQPPLHPTGLWTKADSSANTIGFMYQTSWTSDSKSSSINMIISCPDTTDKTKRYNSSDKIMYGPTSAPLSNNSAVHARLEKELRLPNINLTDSSNSCPFWKDHGIQFLWTSLSNYQTPTAIPLSSSSWTDFPSKVYSFPQLTKSLRNNWQTYSFSTYSQNMEFRPTSLVTGAPSSSPASSAL